MNKHTPGPWSHAYSNDTGPDDDYFIEFFEVCDARGEVIARVEEQPDARLIAAAPDLLEALHHIMLCEFNSMSSRQEMVRVARAAIAKATGEQ